MAIVASGTIISRPKPSAIAPRIISANAGHRRRPAKRR
jgi:hypothetical protein